MHVARKDHTDDGGNEEYTPHKVRAFMSVVRVFSPLNSSLRR